MGDLAYLMLDGSMKICQAALYDEVSEVVVISVGVEGHAVFGSTAGARLVACQRERSTTGHLSRKRKVGCWEIIRGYCVCRRPKLGGWRILGRLLVLQVQTFRNNRLLMSKAATQAMVLFIVLQIQLGARRIGHEKTLVRAPGLCGEGMKGPVLAKLGVTSSDYQTVARDNRTPLAVHPSRGQMSTPSASCTSSLGTLGVSATGQEIGEEGKFGSQVSAA
jgi:hypothetical protein